MLRRLLALALGLALGGMLAAADGEMVTPDAVVERGLAALVLAQQADGGWGHGAGITALAGMALLAGGHTPTRGLHRDASARALRSVLARQDRINGYLGSDYGTMYAHGFATLYLAECHGMDGDANVRRALEAAIDLIQRAQNAQGGWRYDPYPGNADISVTICQVMALRAANNIGIGGALSQQAIGRAIAYVRACAHGDGTFGYRHAGDDPREGAQAVPRSAAGAMSLIGSGVTDAGDATLGPALAFLRRHVAEHLANRGPSFWYGQYYAAQALFHSRNPAIGSATGIWRGRPWPTSRVAMACGPERTALARSIRRRWR